MKSAIVIGHLGETEVRVHISILLLVLLALPRSTPFNLDGFLWSLGFIVALFVCITVHEMMHTLAAHYYQIPVRSITLWPLGGVAEMTREPDRPLASLVIAAAGPLSNLLLALLFGSVVGFEMLSNPRSFLAYSSLILPRSQLFSFLTALAVANLFLALFNLLPIYPMDGGRILHSILHSIFGVRNANRIMFFVSLVLVAGLSIFALVSRDYFLLLISLYLGMGAFTLDRNVGRPGAAKPISPDQQDLIDLRQGYYDEVILRSTAALNFHPNQIPALVNRAIAYLQLEEFGLAEQDLAQIQLSDPRSPVPYGLRAVIAGLHADYIRALQEINQAITLRPELGTNYNNRGWIYTRMGDWKQSLADLDEAIRCNPNSVNAHITRSLIRYRLGDSQGSLQDCEEALRLDANEAVVHDSIYLKNLRGNLDWALDYYACVAQEMPHSPLLFQGRADAFRVNGQYEDAIADYSRAIQLSPHEAALYLGRGLAYRSAGNSSLAANDFLQAVKDSQKSHLRRQAQLLLQGLPATV